MLLLTLKVFDCLWLLSCICIVSAFSRLCYILSAVWLHFIKSYLIWSVWIRKRTAVYLEVVRNWKPQYWRPEKLWEV